MKKYKKLITNLPVTIPKVSLIHSPMKLANKEVLMILKRCLIAASLKHFQGKNQKQRKI